MPIVIAGVRVSPVKGADMFDAGLAVAHPPSLSGTRTPAAHDSADQVRRFMQRWICDRSFREDLSVDPRAAAAARGLVIDPEELRIFWDEGFEISVEELPPAELLRKITPLGLIWIELRRRATEYVQRARHEGIPTDPRFAAWRQRQMARCEMSFVSGFADTVAHIPFAIELSKGCSVGCWFCGISAPSLDGHYAYSNENSASFKTILNALGAIAGRTAGRWGILYWATEPFDHPDYELFCSDFATEFGSFPLTTTAQGWKDMPRTRNLIRLATAGRSRVRLSILNLKILDRYLSELSPAELAGVSFVPVNKESALLTVQAGRARHNRPKSWGDLDTSKPNATSISCASGFLLNVVERSVRLISPCPSSDKWPNGYFVYDERKYTHADELHLLLKDMIERNMHLSPPRGRPLRFNTDLTYRRTAGGFQLYSEARQRDFDGGFEFSEIGDLISSGRLGVSEIVAEMEARHRISQASVLASIDRIFQTGVLAEEPA